MKMRIALVAMLVLGLLLLSGCCGETYRDIKAKKTKITCPTLNLPELHLKRNPFDEDLWDIGPSLERIELPNNIIKDESETDSWLIDCKQGSREGENREHFYCDPWYLKKIETSDTGEIESEERFIVLLEFEKSGNTTKLYKAECYAND